MLESWTRCAPISKRRCSGFAPQVSCPTSALPWAPPCERCRDLGDDSGNLDAAAACQLALEELVQLAFDLATKTFHEDVVARFLGFGRWRNRFADHVLHVNEMKDRQKVRGPGDWNARCAEPAASSPEGVSDENE